MDKFKTPANFYTKESLKGFIKLVDMLDEYIKTLSLKESAELKIKIEIDTKYGAILKFERWQSDLLED